VPARAKEVLVSALSLSSGKLGFSSREQAGDGHPLRTVQRIKRCRIIDTSY
jgi:hypothetical protein